MSWKIAFCDDLITNKKGCDQICEWEDDDGDILFCPLYDYQCCDDSDSIKAARRYLKDEAWYSIKNAPVDGKKILVSSPEEEMPFVAHYHPEEKVWVRAGSNTIVDVELAGYQKLPVNPYYKGDKA